MKVGGGRVLAGFCCCAVRFTCVDTPRTAGDGERGVHGPRPAVDTQRDSAGTAPQ